MNEPDDEKLRKLLQAALPPCKGAALDRDLWPEMLRRFGERPARTSWLDFALAAIALAWFAAFPEALLALLYHL